jgi:hypothetical protein
MKPLYFNVCKKILQISSRAQRGFLTSLCIWSIALVRNFDFNEERKKHYELPPTAGPAEPRPAHGLGRPTSASRRSLARNKRSRCAGHRAKLIILNVPNQPLTTYARIIRRRHS